MGDQKDLQEDVQDVGRRPRADALANRSGIYRLRRGKAPDLVVTGPSLIGLAFDPRGRSMVVTSSDAAYRFD